MAFKENNRVFVTGLGAVSAFGVGVHSLWEGCLSGRPNFRELPSSWKAVSPFDSNVYSPLPRLDYKKYGISRIEQLQYDPTVLNLFVSSFEAIDQASLGTELVCRKTQKLSFSAFDDYEIGVFVGSGHSGISSLLENYRHFLLNKSLGFESSASETGRLREVLKVPKAINRFVVARDMPNAVSAGLGIKFSIKGVVDSAHYACSSSTIAIGRAYQSIQQGRIKLALAGGTEYCNDGMGSVMRSFDMAGTLARSEEGIIFGPFDKNSNGFVFSEGGAAVLAMESEASMLARGSTPLAEVVGFAESFDANSIMAPHQDGDELKRLILRLEEQGGHALDQVDYINAHGAGTKNDCIEAKVYNELMPHQPICNSTKSLLGHTLGASGALEALATILSLQQQKIHGSINVFNQAGGLNLARASVDHALGLALTISSAFGGHNAGLLLKKV